MPNGFSKVLAAIEPSAGPSFAVTVPADWLQGRTVFGGMQMALGGRAMRAVLPLDRFHLSHRLARTVRSGQFEVSADTAFAETVRACAEPRPGHPESWINEPIVALYSELHARGQAHSLECRLHGRLGGGLYGRAGAGGPPGRPRRSAVGPAERWDASRAGSLREARR